MRALLEAAAFVFGLTGIVCLATLAAAL